MLYTKKLFHTLSVFEKRPKNVLKTSQSDSRSMTSLGRPQGVNLIIIHEIGFQGNFLYFLMPIVDQTLRNQIKLKT